MAVKGFSFPDSLVQVENSCGLLFKIWTPQPNPALLTPRADNIFAQPAPDSFAADGSYNSMFSRLPSDFTVCNSEKGEPKLFR